MQPLLSKVKYTKSDEKIFAVFGERLTSLIAFENYSVFLKVNFLGFYENESSSYKDPSITKGHAVCNNGGGYTRPSVTARLRQYIAVRAIEVRMRLERLRGHGCL